MTKDQSNSQQETEDSSEDEQHGDSADGEEEIEVGTRVEVLFGDGTWYPGTVASVPCDQWASVSFDDGDRYTVQFPDPAIRLLSAGQTALPHAGGASSRRWASAASEGGKTVLDGLWCEVCSRSFGSAQARRTHVRLDAEHKRNLQAMADASALLRGGEGEESEKGERKS
mmetsp:Transcript_62820/g.148008  ORF Transcript_62820/g.148008 Transcript_62820/m.148008 type:complete len:170 (+) Transcript_62820:611-1120(+)